MTRSFTRTITVSPSVTGAFRTITSAVANAEPGATISVRPGTYSENLVIDRNCRIVSEEGPGTVVVRASDGAAVVSVAQHAVLSGLTITSSDPERATIDVARG